MSDTNNFHLSANHTRIAQLRNSSDFSDQAATSTVLSILNDKSVSETREKEQLLTEIAKVVSANPTNNVSKTVENESSQKGSLTFSVNANLIQSKASEELAELGVNAYNQKEFEDEAIEQFEKQIKYQDFVSSKSELQKVEKKINATKKQIEDVQKLLEKSSQSTLFEVQKKKNDLIKKQAALEVLLEEYLEEFARIQAEIDSFSQNGLSNTLLKAEETERERLIRIGEITPFEDANSVKKEEKPISSSNHALIERSSKVLKEEPKVSKKRTESEDEYSEYSEYETDEELGYASEGSDTEPRGVKPRVGDWNDFDYDNRVADARFDVTKPENFEQVCGLRVPKLIYDKLFKYQRTGLRWFWNLHTNGTGGILGDEMGLGKTVQMISFLAGLKYSGVMDYSNGTFKGLGPVVIACPATLVKQWVSELNRWWPPFRVAALTSDCESLSQGKVISKMVSGNGILVCSYAILRILEQMIVQRNWHYVILDEGHQIRNPDAKITLTCKNFKTSHRIILSGSPIQNNLKELWSIFDFIYPGKLGTLPAFQEHFATPITQGGYTNANHVQVQTAYKCACVLRDTISPYLLRRVKEDVKSSLTLPKKSEQILFCKLTQEQRDLYKGYIDKIDLRSIGGRKEVLFASLANLRKICNHPRIFESLGKEVLMKDIGEDGRWKESGKMIVVESLLRLWKRQNHRVLIFTQSLQMLRMFEQFLIHFDYKFLKMEGKTNVASRQPMIEQFNSDPSLFIFLLTTKTGGLGINLVGANRVIIYDPDWNPGTDIQARERAWRIGQNKDVMVYRLVCTGTIEEKIYHRQIFKLFLTNRILKDPKQRRFFKTHDLYDLFTLGDEESKGGTETSSIFAGIGADLCANQEGQNKESRKVKYTRAAPLKVVSKNSEVTMKAWKAPGNEQNSKSKLMEGKDDSGSSKEGKRSSKGRRNEKRERRVLKSNIKELLTKWGVSPESEAGKRLIKKMKSSETLKQAAGGAQIDGAKIRGLDKVKSMKRKRKEDEDEESFDDDSDYILGKLFRGGGIQGAIRHDVIEDESQGPDYWLVEKEAEKVAREAVAKLRTSQLLCQSAVEGIPNWTGRSGFIRNPESSKPKFGTKTSLATTGDLNDSERTQGAMTSAEMLKNLRLKKVQGATTSRSTNPYSLQEESSSSESPVAVDEKFLEELVSFIRFHSENPGEATSDELVGQFRKQLGEGNNAIFKAMLQEVCTKTQSFSGALVWTLKPQFANRLSVT